jgi:hypothetical protein
MLFACCVQPNSWQGTHALHTNIQESVVNQQESQNNNMNAARRKDGVETLHLAGLGQQAGEESGFGAEEAGVAETCSLRDSDGHVVMEIEPKK